MQLYQKTTMKIKSVQLTKSVRCWNCLAINERNIGGFIAIMRVILDDCNDINKHNEFFEFEIRLQLLLKKSLNTHAQPLAACSHE